jgi:class 3 adenylate cyclase
LTAEDLKDIGVGAIGHRRKLLDAIAALRTDAKGEMPAEVASTSGGERRQVTIMFSDLVGSTALSTRMDPEDLREVISAYQKCVADTVQHFGGFVAKYMGDGVLVYFGYPQSGEGGIGKSRLVVALLERLATEPHVRLRHFCSPQHTDSALYPIIGQMERAAGFAHDDTPQARLDKLDAVLTRTSTSKEDAALFVDMLSLPNDGRYPTLDLTPEHAAYGTLLREPRRTLHAPASPRPSKANSPRLRKIGLSCWRVTPQRLVRSKRPPIFGAKQANGR